MLKQKLRNKQILIKFHSKILKIFYIKNKYSYRHAFLNIVKYIFTIIKYTHAVKIFVRFSFLNKNLFFSKNVYKIFLPKFILLVGDIVWSFPK